MTQPDDGNPPAHTHPPVPMSGEGPDHFTEAVLASRFVDEKLDGRYVWAKGLGWLAWNGKVWRSCSDESVLEVGRQWVVGHLWQSRDAVLKGKVDNSVAQRWFSVANHASRWGSIVRASKGKVERKPGDFDAHPDLLNTDSGIVDLRTGELLPHDPGLLLTRITQAPYRRGARHPDWTAALAAIPEDCLPYMQVRYGQAVTGHMAPDDVLVVQQGGGENGKSTVMGGIARALGDYFTLISERVLMANPGDHPTEFMDLRGARLALIEETPEARRLNPARLKKVVGTPSITARHIRQDSVTFTATHTLFVSSNYMPIVEETDHGTWRRLMLLRFPYRYRKPHEPLELPTDRRGDPGLRDRVANDPAVIQAALAWLVDGAVVWYAAGRVMPPEPASISRDTQAWREDADHLLGYVSDRLALDPRAHVLATELLADFNAWLVTHGHREWSDKVLASRLAGHDALGARVEKRKVRHSDNLSRRPQETIFYPTVPTPPPAVYTAWIGVRFQADRGASATAPSPANPGGVPAVPTDIDNAIERPYMSDNQTTRNSRNTTPDRAPIQGVMA